ncbi:MAG: TonB-dependent receptor [Bacteroidota bacterium]
MNILNHHRQSLFSTCCLILFLSLGSHWGQAQQTVRGVLLDKDAQTPIGFANVFIQNSHPLIGGTTDIDGKFKLENVPLGRQTIVVTFIGYEPVSLPNIEVTAGKEVVLEIAMSESFETLDEVVVTASANKSTAINELATVSARTLSIEEANRYAASIADPARQAQNFAGVTSGGDDVYNDIIIRGNSPRGLLWRLEGIEILNPNHFASLGGSGGAVSMLSSNVLTSSDFFTGAFPAELGNAMSGVFDLRFRKGNDEKRETTLGAGFLGLELAAEGPFSKKTDASYLFNYRYSTLSILNALNIKVAGDALPTYQDLSFNLHFKSKQLGQFNVFGVGGITKADFQTQRENNRNIFDHEIDDAATGIVGIKHLKFINQKAYIKTVGVVALSDTRYQYNIIENNSSTPDYEEKSQRQQYRISTMYNHKFNARHVWRSGIIFSNLTSDYAYKTMVDQIFRTTLDIGGSSNQLQAYSQWRWRMSKDLTLNTGFHYLHYSLTGQHAFEPRLGLSWKINEQQSLYLGGGLHSRAEDNTVYLVALQRGNTTLQPNRNLGLGKAAHLVLAYDLNINSHMRLKVESYYQALYDVPVSSNPVEKFSVINAQSAYDFVYREDTLLNSGTGRNYGLELTLERFLHNNFYYLATLSLYQSEFSIDGDTYFNSLFNGNYVFNALAGKDFIVGADKQNTFGINAKATFFGGQRFTEIDLERSREAGYTQYAESPFTGKLNDYYRFDIGINYKINRQHATHTFSLNIQNVTNRLNERSRSSYYDANTDQIVTRVTQQAGLIPVLQYKVSF